jgi:8-oxo-dGTP diphosphatase
MEFTSAYPIFSVTVDIVVLAPLAGVSDDSEVVGNWSVLLIKRLNEPFRDHWALPGGFVEIDETLADAATRELSEEAGLDLAKLQPLHVPLQLGTYGDPGRDPRGRTVSVVYLTTIDAQQALLAGSDASEARWVSLHEALAAPHAMAFDHAQILRDAAQALRAGGQVVRPGSAGGNAGGNAD